MLKQTTTTNNECTMSIMGTINMKNNNNISNTDLSDQQNYFFVNQNSGGQNNRIHLPGEVLSAEKADIKLNKSNKMSSFDDNFFLLQQQFSMTSQLPQSQIQSCNTPSTVCGSFVDNSGILSTSEEESFTCPQCYRTYRRHGTLRRHLRQECGKGKSMVCSVCGHRTKRADHLRQHVRKKHPEVAMRSLFRRVSLGTSSGTNDTIVKTSSDGKVVTSNLLQQSVNALTAAVALNLSAAAGTSSGNNLNEIVNLDDDDDDGDNNNEREEEHENEETNHDHKDNKDYYDEQVQQQPESSLDHLRIVCYNATDVDNNVGSFKC